MKQSLKVMAGAVALSFISVSAAPQFPFPQNMANPHGHTIKYADTKMIEDHFNTWKQAWYQDKGNGQAWILSPEGNSSTVSEGIAYGMMIMVYMSNASHDYQSEFDKLWATWKANSVSGGASGMNWRVGSGASNGSATDADVDAALALIMASKQWNNPQYLQEAQSLISWMANSDINADNSVKPGSNWNDAFNPSYGTLANFQLFADVAGGKWSQVVSTTADHLLKCQNATTGLVTDWCSWNSFQPTKTGAAVGGGLDDKPGFFDDAARTPWRTAWSYYWYGNAQAKQFNAKITNWLYSATKSSASNINSGYYPDGTLPTSRDQFVSSTFSGGLGLAAASDETDAGAQYLSTVYNVLKSKTSATSPTATTGEKYYPATLNLLYLLLMTGNMPNFYNMQGFTQFTPDPSLAPSVGDVDGVQQAKGDQTVGVSGFWNWGAYHDKLGIGTTMEPDSGTSPLYLKADGIYAEAKMHVEAEPEWSQEAADAGLLKYPSAGIALSFNAEEKGVDFKALGIKSIRMVIKSGGTIGFGLLNEATQEEGAEPGYIFDSPYDEYTTVTLNIDCGNNCFDWPIGDLEVPSWADMTAAPIANEVLGVVKGVKFEAKMPQGGDGFISVKSLEFLDAAGNVVDPSLITGVIVPEAIKVPQQVLASIAVNGMNLQIAGAKLGSKFAVYNTQGRKITAGYVESNNQSVALPHKGIYLVRVGSTIQKISVK